MANKARSIHTVTHDIKKHSLMIQLLDEIVKGDALFSMGGCPSSSSIQNVIFDDYVLYVDNGHSTQVRNVARNSSPEGAMELIIDNQKNSDK